MGTPLIRVFAVCFSDKQFEGSSPDYHILFENRKGKGFQILGHLPYIMT